MARLGRPSISHATAAGKVMLAFGPQARPPEGELARLHRPHDHRPAALRAELDDVREQGFAEAVGEREADLAATGRARVRARRRAGGDPGAAGARDAAAGVEAAGVAGDAAARRDRDRARARRSRSGRGPSVLPAVNTVAPRVVPAGWLARTQEAWRSGAARAPEDKARAPAGAARMGRYLWWGALSSRDRGCARPGAGPRSEALVAERVQQRRVLALEYAGDLAADRDHLVAVV